MPRELPVIACSLQPAEMPGRLDDWRLLLGTVTGRDPIPGGWRLSFGSRTVLEELVRLVVAEHDCCPFFGFAIVLDGDGLRLEVTAPPEGEPLVTELFGAALGSST